MELLPGFSKPSPSPDTKLECIRYRDRSCCKPGITNTFEENENFQNITIYNICPQKSSLSSACHREFFDELCFFLCSPNIGPWITEATHDAAPEKERFKDVPLCASECNRWWDACKHEFTCYVNWYNDVVRDANGLNICGPGQQCRRYDAIYNSSTNFCETIWDFSFKVTPDDQPCMKFGFDVNKPNPNIDVARRKVGVISACPPFSSVLYFLHFVCVVICILTMW
ncbi:folate receptor alpha-like [Lingula anatina]|uniref:Folate receptor alpha-like n=1 Tax=Lingula anatina TaxID=7574 RepID=A0A2R2MQE2_LINAN|nr:folate receptor alpha-like [Lingula anatina]|eukprot:XP_023932227.1 folate receptor alpha-like [Lingula anatina]